ncbi:MAG: hypothetical protein IT369_22890 [Candidatus Latescibacteria bacterium]|nr:hypothetical protein [Candidatus Latescibacterota bacterium]
MSAPVLRWLRGDLHTHCEDPGLAMAYLEGVGGRLDFAALTNHAQKPALREQAEVITRMRAALPGLVLFAGLEWNTPTGGHACLIFPPSPREHEHAQTFARTFDRLVEGSCPTPAEALAFLGALPPAERPLIFLNHPAPGQWSARDLDQYLEADRAGLIAGLEAVHGHQTRDLVLALDPLNYPGSMPGGLADQLYTRGRPFALLANSDFHIHKQRLKPDYAPGVFNHIRAGVAPARRDWADIFAALRLGRTCAAQGHWLDLADFCVDQARLGDTWTGPGEGLLTLRLDAGEELESLDLIGQFTPDQPPAILHSFGPQPAGPLHRSLAVPTGARGFVRLRTLAANHQRPWPSQRAPRLFFSSAILLHGR